jgi:hypothetical protein
MEELERGLNASRTVDEETDEAVIEPGSADEEFLKAVHVRLAERDELFGESPDYEALLRARPLVATWSLRSRRSS